MFNRAVLIAVLAISSPVAAAAENCPWPTTAAGIDLCDTPEIAVQYWNDLQEMRRQGISPTNENVRKIGKKLRCTFVAKRFLMPADFYDGAFMFYTKPNIVGGYAEPHVYLRYQQGS